MKYQQLKKRLFMESGAIVAALVLLGGGTYFLDTLNGNYLQDSQALENQVNGIAAATNALRAKYDKVQQNMTLYRQIIQEKSQDKLTISGQAMKENFRKFKNEYYLSNLRLSMAPIVDMKEADYKRDTYSIISSDILVSFDGLSDEFTFDLIEGMQQQLPGSSKITRLSLQRMSNLSPEVLHTISEKGVAAIVKGEIKFMWYGIKPLENTDANAPKK